MPQALKHLQEKWKNDVVAIAYLEAGGYKLNRGWEWSHPEYTLETVPDQDYEAIVYLIQEWDFGGFVNGSK